METVAGWIAQTATMITAANIGALSHGSESVVFTSGSIGWSLVGLGSGQTNLLATTAFQSIECRAGGVSHVGVTSGGIGERLHTVPRERIDFDCDRLALRMTEPAFAQVAVLDTAGWPAWAAA